MQYLYERVRSEDGTEVYAGQAFISKTISTELTAEWAACERRVNLFFSIMLTVWAILFLAWILSPAVGAEVWVTYLLGALTLFFWLPMMLLRKLVLPEKTEKKLSARCWEELSVPSDAAVLELVYPTALEKHGWVNGNHKGYLCTSAFFRVYLEDGFLHLASAVDVMQIPWASLTCIEAEEKGRLKRWIQKRPLRSFRKYRVTKHAADNYSIYFHRIIIRDTEGEFYFCLPNYEIERFCEMTKMYINEA